MSAVRTIQCPNRAVWLEARRHGIGASEAAAILGLSPFATPLEVFADKLGLLEAVEPTEEMTWGLLLEPLVAARYAEETKRRLAEPTPLTIHVHPEHEFLRATLDRVIVEAEGKPCPAPLELKTASAYDLAAWAEEPPIHVQIQVQHQLLVTGDAWASVAALIGGQKFVWSDIERNDEFIAAYLERACAFWRRVELGEAPEPGAEDRDVLAQLYPRERAGETIPLPPEAEEWDSDREDAIVELKRWGSVKEQNENRLKAAIGEAAYGRLPSGIRYSWRTVERPEVLQPAVSYRQLRRHLK
jgi:putative phage-type endonuclease